jgi:hypothetical protein
MKFVVISAVLASALAAAGCRSNCVCNAATPKSGSGSATPVEPATTPPPTTTPPPVTTPPPATSSLPAECLDYKAAIDKLQACDKLPKATRDALKQSYDSVSAAWASVPAEQLGTLGTGCKQATDAVKQSAAATCGW